MQISDYHNFQSVFSAQQKAFKHNPYPSYKARISALKHLRVELLRNKGDLAQAVSKDFGHRAAEETLLAEILQLLETIDYVCTHLHRWMKKQKRKIGFIFQPAENFVYYQPLGVVGIIAPWNYPILLSVSPLIFALAAGNCVCIKMSEYTPNTYHVIERICRHCFDQGKVAVFNGNAEFAKQFSETPFDHLLFTGSTQTGKKVYQAASENLTPVTLELGGKSPLIIDKGYSIQKVAKTICFSKSLNSGQTCIAPDYVFVHQQRLEELVAALKQSFMSMYPDFANNTQYSSILQPLHYQRLHAYLDQAKEAGCKVVPLLDDSRDIAADLAVLRKMPLTLIVNPADDSDVMNNEIFGAILPILTYQHIDEVQKFINKHDRPLALYLFSNDTKVQSSFFANTHSGGVCINDALTHIAQDDLPFGGVGHSGIGRYHAKEGFITFSNCKSVFKRKRVNFATLLYPPYGRMFKYFARLFIR